MRKNKENVIQLFKYFKDDIDMTEEQLQFFLKEYQDKKFVMGIHNTSMGYQTFFENGIYNYTDFNKTTRDLTNTLYCSDVLASLLVYPNGDGKRRGKTAIIVKIPHAVFLKKQGIFETLKNGLYGIPPQFIRAAFVGGKVFENESYDKHYQSKKADLSETEQDVIMNNKKWQVKVFKEVYDSKTSIWERLKQKFSKTKPKQLEAQNKQIESEESCFSTSLQEGVPSLEEQSDFSKEFQNQSKEEVNLKKTEWHSKEKND